MKNSLLIFTIILCAVPILLYAEIISSNNIIKTQKTVNKEPAAIYDHQKIAAKIGDKANDCEACHNAVDAKDTAHKYCTKCHETMKSGPTQAKCTDCHKSEK